MFFFNSLVILLAAAVAGVSEVLNITGVDDGGYYYTFSSPDSTNISVWNYNGDLEGIYSLEWAENAKFLGGKGWEIGSAENVGFWSDFDPVRNTLYSVYGWTTAPLVEYRIVEAYVASAHQFAGLTLKGNVTSDGSVYNIYEAKRVNHPSILGIADFTQYWSVRQSPRGNGTGVVSTQNHIAAWAALGMPLGDFGYQIFAVETDDSGSNSGRAGVWVSRCSPE